MTHRRRAIANQSDLENLAEPHDQYDHQWSIAGEALETRQDVNLILGK